MDKVTIAGPSGKTRLVVASAVDGWRNLGFVPVGEVEKSAPKKRAKKSKAKPAVVEASADDVETSAS